jgi:PhzF family phenazine biosynthesis protein
VKSPYFEVNAFIGPGSLGNPAGVCPLDRWPSDGAMQRVAAEKGLSEVAFFVAGTSSRSREMPPPGSSGGDGDEVPLRWFTPSAEVDLCGHATLSAAHVLYAERGWTRPSVRFSTKSGVLTVVREGDRLVLDLPVLGTEPGPAPEALVRGLGVKPAEVFRSMDYVAVLEDEAHVRALKPDLDALKELDLRGVVVTAPGKDRDYVLRCFAPKFGIAEDPVTGSAQCELTAYWSARLGKREFSVRQLSARGGELTCRLDGGRVKIAGKAEVASRGIVEF